MPGIIVFDVNETLLQVSRLAPLFEQSFGDAGALKDWFSLLLLHSEVATPAGCISISQRWGGPSFR